MSSAGAASRAAVPASHARAQASRRNGARSRGPKAPEGKARSARNALQHGLRAEKYVVFLDEDWDEFVTLEAALTAELAPDGALQSIIARRVARAAAWPSGDACSGRWNMRVPRSLHGGLAERAKAEASV